MKNFFLGVFVTILVLGIGIGGFLLGQNKSIDKTDFSLVTPTPTIGTISTPTPQDITPTIDEGELIKTALFKKNNWKESDGITVHISTNDGKYASGTSTAQGGGGYFYAVKDSGIWVIVADGNGIIDCSSLIKYPDYPKILIPECYNTSTNKTVKR